MAEKDEKKVKGFRLTPKVIDQVEKLIKDSGYDNDGEWFTEVIHKIAINELVLDKDGISPNLRKQFSNDTASLKDAMNLINATFINQMNRIAVEKKVWDEKFIKNNEEYERKISTYNEQVRTLETTINSLEQELQESSNIILTQNSRIDNFNKLEEQLRKDIQRLEDEKDKLEQNINNLKNEFSLEKQHYHQVIEENRKTSKETVDKLNQQIVDLLNRLEETEEVRNANEGLKGRITGLENTLKEQKRNFDIEIKSLSEHAKLEQEKALLARELELREKYHQENRQDQKELYAKIEEQQMQIEKLRIELERLKNPSR